MKKTILIGLALFASTTAFAHTSSTDKKPVLQPLMLESAEMITNNFLKVVPGQIQGFDSFPSEKVKLQKAFLVIEAVVNSAEFKNRVIAFKGSGPKGGYTSNNNLTNEEIYNFLMRGHEILDGDTTEGEMNVDITRYTPWYPSKVIGSTSPGKSKWIKVNGQHYKSMDVAGMASNVTHEWIHLNGFLHDSAADHDSVPYTVGYIVNDLAKKFLAQGYLE
jgi:hypothetical protein